MFFLLPSLLGILLVATSQLATACDSNQCESQLVPNNCVDLLASEELDCLTYTCQSMDGNNILVKDPDQEKRCKIGEHCYKADNGPNACTYCQEEDDGTMSVRAGCMKRDGTCAAPEATFTEGCNVMLCTVQNHAASITAIGTTGCSLGRKCYAVGEKTFRYTCNECTYNTTTKLHRWNYECRDPRNNQCFTEYSIYDIFCRTYICSNRNGIGWYRYGATAHCEISTNDCVTVGSTSLRDGYCYHCDNPQAGEDGPQTSLGCPACGKCLKRGETKECGGQIMSCDSVEDPPDEANIKCRIGETDVLIGRVHQYQCNWYRCTEVGVWQLTSRCSYNERCYRAGTMVDASKCLRCVSDGASTSLEQGCKHGGQCVALGQNIRVNCVTKTCAVVGETIKFIPTDYQPTPCRCLDQCYPLGPFVYGHGGLCAECKSDGTIDYACKLANGQCLDAGEVEETPTMGCYKMQCTKSRYQNTYRFSLHKADGQPLRCTAPGGVCIEENERLVIDGKTYICVAGDKCVFDNEILNIGDERTYYCHKFVCTEFEVDGTKKTKMEIAEFGCPYGDGECKPLGSQFDMNCDTYQCKVPEGEKYARNVVVTERCPCDGHCLEVDEYLWTSRCVKRTCTERGRLEVSEVQCVWGDDCVPAGETKEYHCGTYQCNNVNNMTMEFVERTECSLYGIACISVGEYKNVESYGNCTCNELSSNTVSCHTMNTTANSSFTCTFNGTQPVPSGDTISDDCNTYICEVQDDVPGLYIQGQARCAKRYTNGTVSCILPEETESCETCHYDETNTARPLSTSRECPFIGVCVAGGASVEYSCVNYRCNADTYAMEQEPKTKCRYNGVCVPDGESHAIAGYGDCTCSDPQANLFSCSQPPNACILNGETVQVNETKDSNCNLFRCEDRGAGLKMHIIGDGFCKLSHSENTSICVQAGETEHCVKCHYDEAQPTVFPYTTRECIAGSSCVPPGNEVDYKCARHTCNGDNYALDLVAGSRTQCSYGDFCVNTGAYEAIPDGRLCKCSNLTTNSIRCAPAEPCILSNSTKVALGTTVYENCNSKTCEERNDVFSMYIHAPGYCAFSGGVCLEAGKSTSCWTCHFDAATNQLSTTRECQSSNGCIAPGEEGDHNCGRFRCNADTYQLEEVSKTDCSWHGTCITPGEYKVIQNNGQNYNCTCGTPATNTLSC